MSTLEIRNISKTYKKGAVKALDNFNVVLTPGVYGLLGPNGAGKSTLMNIITDNLNADSGDVLYDGENIKKLGKNYRSVLGYMPQQQGLYDDFTLNRFLWYMAALKGLKKKEAKEKITSLLDTVNLTNAAHKKLGGFSGGMKQRALIAQALLNDPKILILDEPTAGLDVEGRLSLHEQIRKLNSQGKTIILASHDMAEVETLCDRIAILNNGNIVFCGTPSELTDRLGRKYFIHLKTQDGEKSFETDTIEDTLISLLEECKQKHIQILDIKVDRGTLEQHFIEMARRGSE